MDLELKDKVIIVTGGASGIGAGIVSTLQSEGARPVILDKSDPKDSPNPFYQVDLTDMEDLRETIEQVVEKFESIDGIVNNAGGNDGVGISKSPEAFLQSLQVNLIQCFSVVHFAIEHLRKSDAPAIVNIASKVGLTGQGGTSGYAASKGGLLGLTREWALDFAADGIRVNAVLPAEVWTSSYEKWLSSVPDPATRRAGIEANIPLGQRMTEIAEIADTVAFLLSPRSSHTTGQFVHVDGGYVHLDRAYTGEF